MFRRRLYFMVPDEPQATRVVSDLEAAGIGRQHMHAIAGKGVALTQLPPATERQRRDAAYRLERLLWNANLGLFFLGFIGLAISLASSWSIGLVLSIALMVLTLVAGALFALRIPDTHLDEFRGVLSHGEVLLMVDVPKRQVADIEELLYRRHPEVAPGGTGWTIEALRL